MKFRLPLPVMSREISQVTSREIRKQKLNVIRVSKKMLQEISEVAKEIEQRGIPKYLVRKKLSQGLGYGLFLHPKAQPILKGTVIAPYSGKISFVPQYQSDDSAYAFEVLTDIHLSKKEQALFDPKNRYHPRRLYCLNLDAWKEGNFTRLINHSEKPNVIAHLYSIPKNSYGFAPLPVEVIYIAKKTIRPGEQLLVSYEDKEKSYWGPLKIKPFPVTPQTFRLSPSLELIS